MKKIRILGIALAMLVSACSSTTTIPYDLTYDGEIYKSSLSNNGYVSLQTKFITSQGIVFDNGWVNNLNSVLSDAFKKEDIEVDPVVGKTPYKLVTTVTILPEYDLWKAVPKTGANMGMAAIPVAGLFTPRYYSVSTGFAVAFSLLQGDEIVYADSVTVSETKEVSVSNNDRERESREHAIRLWEEKRDLAVEQLMRGLAEKYPSGA